MATAQPSYPTVYVNNLNERVKIPDLVTSLRSIFEEFGQVRDILAKSSLPNRGQAFVIFEKVDQAQRAMDALNGFPLHGKPIRTHNVYQPSDATVESMGKKALEEHKKRRTAQKEYQQAMSAQKAAAEAGRREFDLKRAGAPTDGDRKSKMARGPGGGLKSTATSSSAVIPDEYLPPNRILFVSNIPEGYDVDALTSQFSRFQAFKEVRLVPGRAGIAFVEYTAEAGAIDAKNEMAGKTLPGFEDEPPLKVVYQRQ
jgi:RNA recognition motif-containing protein